MERIFTGQWGFPIGFVTQIPLTGMTAMRMLISRPYGPPATYDFAIGEFNTIDVGGSLIYTVREDDLPLPGTYAFQVIGRDGVSETPFTPFVLPVEPRVATVAWP